MDRVEWSKHRFRCHKSMPVVLQARNNPGELHSAPRERSVLDGDEILLDPLTSILYSSCANKEAAREPVTSLGK